MRLTLVLLAALLAPTASTDEASLKAEAELLIAALVGELKPTQRSAIDAGPYDAIQVCAEKAPEIAERLSRESGWTIRRISLQPRNARTATPDTWATAVLREFEGRKAQGEPADSLVHAETVGDEFRFLKAQPVESRCLLCHGTNIAAVVKQQLDKHYPADRATGFALGDLRGAFYLTRSLGGNRSNPDDKSNR